MSFFKKIGRGISNAFKKAPGVISNIFKKGEDVAGKVAGGLSSVADVLGSVASNPLVEAGASALLGPEAGIGLAGLGQASKLLKSGSGIVSGLQGASQTARTGNIAGGISQLKNTIESGRGLMKQVGGVAGPMDGVRFQ
jgi:hypothetical protein